MSFYNVCYDILVSVSMGECILPLAIWPKFLSSAFNNVWIYFRSLNVAFLCVFQTRKATREIPLRPTFCDTGSNNRQLGYFLWKTEVRRCCRYEVKGVPIDHTRPSFPSSTCFLKSPSQRRVSVVLVKDSVET